jgi:hypothetical protein
VIRITEQASEQKILPPRYTCGDALFIEAIYLEPDCRGYVIGLPALDQLKKRAARVFEARRERKCHGTGEADQELSAARARGARARVRGEGACRFRRDLDGRREAGHCYGCASTVHSEYTIRSSLIDQPERVFSDIGHPLSPKRRTMTGEGVKQIDHLLTQLGPERYHLA